MATSLRDLAPAPRRRRGRGAWQPAARPAVLFDPRGGAGVAPPGRRRRGLFDGGPRRRRRLATIDRLLLLAAALVALFLVRAAWNATRVDIDVVGLSDGQSFTFEAARSMAVTIEVRPADRLAGAELRLDGEILEDAETTDAGFRWVTDGPMATGSHRLELTVPRPILPASSFRWDFTVDATPPTIDTPTLLEPRGLDEEVVIRGRVDPDARLTARGEDVDVEEGGRFEISYDSPPPGAVRLVARDPAGHTTVREVFAPVKRPAVRGVHISAAGWASGELRSGVLALVDQGLINTIEIDLKDEGGEVGYDSEVPLARRVGAVKRHYDLEKVVQQLHERKVRVVGRLVAFRDPILASYAWSRGDRDWVVQHGNGLPDEMGFTNFANPGVQAYNLAIAEEAVAAGVDEVLWDYIRRPEPGVPDDTVFPGLRGSPEDGVVRFLTTAHELIRNGGALQGASLFGVSARSPESVGQNVPRIARHVDYIAPMVYPSLWVPGQYKVRDPANMPFEIVARSLQDFKDQVEGTGVHITPWLQDFSLKVTYTDAHVRAQIDAARSIGIDDWLLWSPRVRYHAGGIPQR